MISTLFQGMAMMNDKILVTSIQPFLFQWIEPMADANVDQYTFHIEPVDNVPQVIRKIKEAGMKVGLAIKPKTPVDVIAEYIDSADLVLIMTVEPGFGGQKFMQDMMPKVKWLRDNYPTLNIEVDGGVGPNTIDECGKVCSQFTFNFFFFFLE